MLGSGGVHGATGRLHQSPEPYLRDSTVGGSALDAFLRSSAAGLPPLVSTTTSIPTHHPRAWSLQTLGGDPSTALLHQSTDGSGPMLAVESAFIFPAGMQPVPPPNDDDDDDDNLETAGHARRGGLRAAARVSDSMAELWARPSAPKRQTASAPGVLAESVTAAEAAAEAPPGLLSTVRPLDEAATSSLEPLAGAGASSGLGAGAVQLGDDADEGALNAGTTTSSHQPTAELPPAAAQSAAAQSAAAGGRPLSTPLDIESIAHRNADKLRLLNSIDSSGEGVEALDAFLKRFVAEQEVGNIMRTAGTQQQTGPGGSRSGSGAAAAGVRFDLTAGQQQGPGVDSLDRELDRLGLLPAAATLPAAGGGGADGGGSTVNGSGRRLRTSLSSFACRLAQPAVAPPVGIAVGPGLLSSLLPLSSGGNDAGGGVAGGGLSAATVY